MKLDELQAKIGQELGVSDWHEIGQDRINQFADATEDHQYIHVDPERAKDSPFGQTIAHGFLTLSMLAPFLGTGYPEVECSMTVNYGFDKIRFVAPVKSGKRIRGRFRLKDFSEVKPGQWQATVEVTVEIEGEEKPAILADWMIRHFA